MSWLAALTLLPLDVLPPTPSATGVGPVFPQRGQGFAAYIVGGFFGLGILVLAMVLLGLKPRRARPPGPND